MDHNLFYAFQPKLIEHCAPLLYEHFHIFFLFFCSFFFWSISIYLLYIAVQQLGVSGLFSCNTLHLWKLLEVIELLTHFKVYGFVFLIILWRRKNIYFVPSNINKNSSKKKHIAPIWAQRIMTLKITAL